MKSFLKGFMGTVVALAVIFGAFCLGYYVAKNKYDTDNATYLNYGSVKKVIESSYEAITGEDIDDNSGNDSQISSTQKVVNVSKLENKVIIYETPQTNADVLTEQNGSVIKIEEDVSLDLKTIVANPIKMVRGLLNDGKLSCFNDEYAVTYQVRNAENMAPSDFDVKLRVTANVGSLTIYMIISEEERIISNSIVVLTYEGNFQITNCCLCGFRCICNLQCFCR